MIPGLICASCVPLVASALRSSAASSALLGQAKRPLVERGRLRDRQKLQDFVLFDVLEVFVGADFQFVGGLLVADDDTMLMHLEGRDGPHVVDGSLDSCLQSACLRMSICQDHHLTGIHHRTNTDCQGVSRHILWSATEETGVGNAGVGRQGLHAGS